MFADRWYATHTFDSSAFGSNSLIDTPAPGCVRLRAVFAGLKWLVVRLGSQPKPRIQRELGSFREAETCSVHEEGEKLDDT